MILSDKDLQLLNSMPSSSEPDSSNSPHGELKIEFDGTTVLCRVCGDKASGFHYGVHSCEGCKGFFRRSIQQKIQYRPCTKNQQCSILRINRNRCQYCRLKKCIAVGMSRDAVRFGRVPKREKAKILAAMQKVNMSSMEKQLNEQLEDENKLLQSLLQAHDETCDYTKDKVIPLIERARTQPVFASCPPQMACPLNPMPQHVDGTNRILEDFSERFSPAIRGVVEFAKRIPGFAMLSQDDQVTLLKAGVFEVLLVRLACMFDSTTNSMICLNGLVLRRESLHSASNARFLMDSMFDFAERMNGLRLTDHEIGLFSAVVVIAPDRPGLRNTDLVQKIHRKLDNLLQKSVNANHPEDAALFAELKKKIPDLRTLNTLHSEKLLAFKMEPRLGQVASSTSAGDSNHTGLVSALLPDRWHLLANGHSSPNGSDWTDSPKDLHELSYGSPRSVSSSVMSADESATSVKSPPRSSSVSSAKSTHNGYAISESQQQPPVSFSPTQNENARCPKRAHGASLKSVSSTSAHPGSAHSENGCSSGDESYFSETPIKNGGSGVSSKIRRVDSPTDSGIESGKEHCSGSTPTTSVCSSPRSALDEKVKDVSDSESNEKQETIDDMPMLKRALQAPPLINTNMLMDEAYRHHKKFRASKREGSSPSPSTTTPQSSSDSLASTHSTLVKTLEQAPRYLSEQQLKRTDLIHNIIMRTESLPTSTSSAQYPLQHQALSGHKQHQPQPQQQQQQQQQTVLVGPHGYYIPPGFAAAGGCPYTGPKSRIMFSGSTQSLQSEGLAAQRRSPLMACMPTMAHSPPALVTTTPPPPHKSPALAIKLSQSSDQSLITLSDSQPLNLSMSKRPPSTSPTAVKLES